MMMLVWPTGHSEEQEKSISCWCRWRPWRALARSQSQQVWVRKSWNHIPHPCLHSLVSPAVGCISLLTLNWIGVHFGKHAKPLSLFKGWQASCGAVCGSCRVFRTMNRVASAPSCSAFIHRVALEEVSGHRVLIKSKTEKSWSFGMWHQHEATSRISSWDWPHPEVHHEGREPLLDKAVRRQEGSG